MIEKNARPGDVANLVAQRDRLLTERDDLQCMVIELCDELSAMLDYAGEGNCGRLIGFRESWKSANAALEKAYSMLPNEEAEHLAELERGYAQDRM